MKKLFVILGGRRFRNGGSPSFFVILFAFPFAVALALGAEVVTKHRAEDEILLGR